jgi:tetratricopeptide (TPR) repeat protein
VNSIVEGTVAQFGDRLRVTANLIQVSPEKHLWARAYERNSHDVLGLQNEVAAAVALEIQGKLTPAQQTRMGRSHPVNPDAQLAYWKARYFLNALRDPEATRKSIEYSEQAVRLEPQYAAAHAALAMAYTMLSGGSTIPPDAVNRARSAARMAIDLDDKLSDAYVGLGSVLLLYDWDWAGAEREFKRAIDLNPSNAEAHQWLSSYLAAVGRLDEAVATSRRARELDPLSFRTNWRLGRILCFARKYDEALSELRHASDMQRNSSMVDVWIVKVCLKKGLTDEAVTTDLRIRGYRDGLSDASLHDLQVAYSASGLRGYWRRLRRLVLPKFHTTANGAYRLAEINAYLGDKEEAFRWLEKAYESRTNWMPWVKVDPSLDALRSDSRFDVLLRRMGLRP